MRAEKKQVTSKALLAALALLTIVHTIEGGQAGKSPVKVFILAGQSNMEGQGKIKIDTKRNRKREFGIFSQRPRNGRAI